MEFKKVKCIQCQTEFDRPIQRGRPHTKCPGCRILGQAVTEFALAQQRTEIIDGVVMVENKLPCLGCNEMFMRPKKKGTPPARCIPCKELYEDTKTKEVTVSQEQLEEAYTGPKEKLLGDRKDLPVGMREAQCPGCWRIFTSNHAAESHQEYNTDGSLKNCKDPATQGMIPIEKRGLPIWRKPMDPEELARRLINERMQ